MAALAAQRSRARFEPAADPNVIPFIDVLLVLLIIFMVTAPKPNTDLRVDLPRPGGTPIIVEIPPTIVHILKADGGVRFLVGAETVSRNELAQTAIAQMLAADAQLTREHVLAEGHIFVRADLDVDYHSVVSAVEDLRAAQFEHVAIVAQDADEG